MPDAPPLLSNRIGWPSSRPVFSMTMRVEMSVGPPGGYGITILIWRVGQPSASAGKAADAPSAETPSVETNLRRSMMIFPDPLLAEAFHGLRAKVQR